MHPNGDLKQLSENSTLLTDQRPSLLSGTSNKNPFLPAEKIPTLEGPEGVRFDFNLGARILLPKLDDAKWKIRLKDIDTGNIIYENISRGSFVTSTKKWFVRFRVDIWKVDINDTVHHVLKHDFDGTDRDILIQFPIGTLGDTLAWFPAAARFARKHKCRLTCSMSALIIPLLKEAYPDINFVTPDYLISQHLLGSFYATYRLGLFFDDTLCNWQPTDFRQVGLHHTASYLLGLEESEEAPRFVLPNETRPIAQNYVVIAVQATTQAKTWTNPTGWHEVVDYVKKMGYRVVCIDQKRVHGSGIVWTHIPHGAEDLTGDIPLTERARWLRHASAFIGLASGLSWLAWGAGCPVIMISGFSHPLTEFHTPFRVVNWHVCNSCWNDIRHRFDHKDHLWCPRHAGTPRQFECTRLITAEQVIHYLNQALKLHQAHPRPVGNEHPA